MKRKEARHTSPDLGSLTFLYEPNIAERRRTRIGISVAVLAHVVLFVINWPTIARSAPEEPDQPVRILVLRPFRPAPPPPPTTEAAPRPPVDAEPVPIPGPENIEPNVVRHQDVDPQDYDEPRTDEPHVGPFPTAPPPPPDTTVAISGFDVEQPAVLYKVEPRYTESARRSHIEGVVILDLTIGRSGHVEQTAVLRGLPLGLTEEAVKATRQWVFAPSTFRGRPVRVQYILTVRFSLR